jgi:hypothetical protein
MSRLNLDLARSVINWPRRSGSAIQDDEPAKPDPTEIFTDPQQCNLGFKNNSQFINHVASVNFSAPCSVYKVDG